MGSKGGGGGAHGKMKAQRKCLKGGRGKGGKKRLRWNNAACTFGGSWEGSKKEVEAFLDGIEFGGGGLKIAHELGGWG